MKEAGSRMYLYILLCTDETFYTGVTNDLEHRFGEHQSGKDPNSYTFSRRPVQLVYSEGFTSPEAAIAMEKRIKKWSHAKKQALVDGEFGKLVDLAKKKF